MASPGTWPRIELPPDEAKSEGERLLRIALSRQTYRAMARRLCVDERAVRRWARGHGKPSRGQRQRAFEVLGIPVQSWDEKPEWV